MSDSAVNPTTHQSVAAFAARVRAPVNLRGAATVRVGAFLCVAAAFFGMAFFGVATAFL